MVERGHTERKLMSKGLGIAFIDRELDGGSQDPRLGVWY